MIPGTPDTGRIRKPEPEAGRLKNSLFGFKSNIHCFPRMCPYFLLVCTPAAVVFVPVSGSHYLGHVSRTAGAVEV